MSIIENIENIYENIRQIQQEEPEVADILFEGLGISLDLLREISLAGGRESFDVSKQLQLITNVLGVSLEDLIKVSLQNGFGADIQKNMGNQFTSSTKEPDNDIMQYIMSDIDNTPKNVPSDSNEAVKEQTIKFISKKMNDYENFLAESNLQDNIDFLQKKI